MKQECIMYYPYINNNINNIVEHVSHQVLDQEEIN